MSSNTPVFPKLFKGIALFTPGGDLIYCLDSSKQGRWHSHLCGLLQELLGLPEPPHFLVPGYTATVDRWCEAKSQEIKAVAEVYPAVQRYQPLLNAVFATGELIWKTAPWQEEFSHPSLIETYRSRFPQLWENHDLIVRLEQHPEKLVTNEPLSHQGFNPLQAIEASQGYILRLFVSGNNPNTQRTLETIYQLLEQELKYPYTLKVIDISKHPEQAESHQISATPTLVRVLPQPVRRIVGELEDLPRVLQIITTR